MRHHNKCEPYAILVSYSSNKVLCFYDVQYTTDKTSFGNKYRQKPLTELKYIDSFKCPILNHEDLIVK